MLARAILCIFAISFPWSALAQPDPATAFGQGLLSCSKWTPTTEVAYSQWILGYLSGLNLLDKKDHHVGRDKSEREIVDKVREMCALYPDDTLAAAAFLAWFVNLSTGH